MPISKPGSAPCRAQPDPSGGDRFCLAGEVAVIATMHGKERVIAPVLSGSLGLDCLVPPAFDTDRFGTFTREIERAGSPLDAVRAKAAAAFERVPHARVAVASEGSFGPHPEIPFAPLGREVVLLVDRHTGLEVVGRDATMDTNFAHCIVDGPQAAFAFAERVHFPGHGLIVMGCRGDRPDPHVALQKGIAAADALERAVREAVALCGGAFVATDMRAHFSPTRMQAIERATLDLVRRYGSRCPVCSCPGFDVTARVPGLPCAWCGEPTQVTRAEVLSCAACGHRSERSVGDGALVDPGMCDHCNP
ncbi:MAG TPA: DUF6671 family protein [Chthonomonadales bacterium]|nr:DUF6671 family protein [Chthonomonadales bacterium]